MTPAPLEVIGQAPLDLRGVHVFRDGLRCDPDGNIFFVPMGATEVVRVPASGAPAQTIDLAAELGRATSRGLTLQTMGVDGHGGLRVVVSDRRTGRQHIVSFDARGELVGLVPLDVQEIIAHKLAVFGSGGYFLVGSRPESQWPEAVIANSSGRVRHDVEGPVSRPSQGVFDVHAARVTGAPALEPIDDVMSRWPRHADLNMLKTFVTPTADGHVLFAREGGPVYRVSASGRVDRRIDLVPPPSGVLLELNSSGPRLAVVYDVRGDAPSRWVDVYDIDSGVPRARYGPVREGVLCYQADGERDRFDLLGGKDGQAVLLHATAR